MAESNQSPFGKLEPLAVLKTNPDGAGIVQAIGPLKTLAGNDPNSSAPQLVSRRYRPEGFIAGGAATSQPF